MTDQLALPVEADDLSDLDLEHMERVLAEHAVRATHSAACRCEPRPVPWHDEQTGELGCLLCGREVQP